MSDLYKLACCLPRNGKCGRDLPAKGDLIRLDHMGDDPCPMEPGAIGTVISVCDMHPNCQIGVRWENVDRSLNLCPSADEWTVLQTAEDRQAIADLQNIKQDLEHQ